MMSLYDQFVSEGDSFEDALKETFSTVLISDPFLYVAAPIPLEDHQSIFQRKSEASLPLGFPTSFGAVRPMIACSNWRLEDKLSDPAVLANEVSRMLRDSRARRFSERFAREWLRLDKYGLVAINPEFYPQL